MAGSLGNSDPIKTKIMEKNGDATSLVKAAFLPNEAETRVIVRSDDLGNVYSV